MHYFQLLLSAYGWQGLALVAIIIVLLCIQIFYYSFRFRRLGKYLNKRRKKLHESPPPISVVVPMFSEDYEYCETTLPMLLSQEGAQVEVVIVYVGCDGDFYDDLIRLKEYFPNIVATKIERNERFPISVKTALNVGIKASSHEHILFTTTDAHPVSTKWVSQIARGFQRGDVVLSYCAVETPDNKFDSYFIRTTRLFDSMLWLSRAIHGKPYRAIRSNMGFTKNLYFKVKGFNRLNMNIGEDDLFMQEIMKNDNASVILSPRSTVFQSNWGRMDGLIDTQRYYGSAIKFYPLAARNFIDWELTSRTLFFGAAIVGMLFLPLELKVLIALLSLLRLCLVLGAVKKFALRVGEQKVVGRYLFYDLLSPLFALYMHIVMIKRDKRVWR